MLLRQTINVEDSCPNVPRGKSKAFLTLRAQSREEGRSQEGLLATVGCLQGLGQTWWQPWWVRAEICDSTVLSQHKHLCKNWLSKEWSTFFTATLCFWWSQRLPEPDIVSPPFIYVLKVLGHVMPSLKLHKCSVIPFTKTVSPWQSFPMLFPLQMS